MAVRAMAQEGLQGLSTIDPAISGRIEGNQVILTHNGATIATYAAPAENDSGAWARILVAAFQDGQKVSAPLAAADAEGLYEAVFVPTLAKLDRFSRYSGVEKAKQLRSNRTGFGGVGIRFEVEEHGVSVLEATEDGPAAKAGLTSGDIITHIDGAPTAGLDAQQVADRLRGAIGSNVSLTVTRADQNRTVALRRSLVVPNTVTMKIEDDTAVIRITSFNQRTGAQTTEAVREAREQLGDRLKGVVLDLRGNPGGLLDQAVHVADLFMKEGPIVSTRGRHTQANQFYSARPGDIGEDLSVVVLVDGRSASSSEIVTSALQDSGRAVVIGTNSYGKGTVQTVLRMPNEGEMTITWSRYYSPAGYALHNLGVLPNICTSDETANPVGLINAVMTGTTTVSSELAQWRATSFEQTDLREQLRTHCPSQQHADYKMDLELAKQVLSNKDLYRRAVNLSTPGATIQAAMHHD